MNKKSTKLKLQNKQQAIATFLVIVSLFFFSASLYVFQASKPKVYEYGIYKTGTAIATGSVNTVIQSLKTEKGTGPTAAPAGKKYLIIDISFTNTSKKSVQILPSTQTYIKDANGRVYYLTPYALEQPFRAGELLPGDTITGELSYLVPEATSYTMYIDSIWSGGVVSVRLT